MDSGTLLEVLEREAGPRLRATSVPGVLKLTEPLAPWKRSEVVELKRRLLEQLFHNVGDCRLWLDQDDLDSVSELGVIADHGRGRESPAWLSISGVQVPKLPELLYRGAWGLFFGAPSSLAPFPPTTLSFEPAAVVTLTESVGARASVISWHDDVEWLVCVRNQRGG